MGDFVGSVYPTVRFFTCAFLKEEQERADPLSPRVTRGREMGAEAGLKRGTDDPAKQHDERWNSKIDCGEQCCNDCPPYPFK